MFRVFSRWLVLLSLPVLLAGVGFSQNTQSGAIAGSVTDPNGAVVSGADVTIVNDATKALERTIATGGNGQFSAALLTPGDYTVTVKKNGFKAITEKVQVLLNETSRLNAILEVGTAAEVVEVRANATMLNTESPVMGQTIDAATMHALPLPVPNFMFLLSLSAGTAGEFPDVRDARLGGGRSIVDINVNGQRTTNNSQALEGINVNDFNAAHFDTVPLPNIHAVEEFNIATSLYDATSETKGGGAVGLVFKSGTKDWHGEAYWQHRNDWLNANEWFFNNAGVPRQKFLQNVLGFSGSGPMPFLGGNWFANVQGLRARNGVNPFGSSTTVISPNFPTNPDGTTSAALIGPAFGLTPGQVDPTALRILNDKNSFYGGTFLIPRAGQSGCSTVGSDLHCIFAKVTPVNDTQYSISYDRHFFGEKSKISGRWFYDNGDSNLPFGTASSLAFPKLDIQKNRFFTLSHTQEISARQLNVLRFGFSRFIASFAPTDEVSLADIGATRPNSGTIPGIYQVIVTGAFSLGTGQNDDRGTVSNTFDSNDTWSMILGKHTLKIGGNATRYQLNRFNRFGVRGSLDFNSFTDFLKGQIDRLGAASGNPARYFRALDYGAFIQDDYRILSNLTLNLGLRWDSLEFAHDLLLRSSSYDPSLVPNGNPFLFPSHSFLPGIQGTPGVGDCGTRTCRANLNFGPRAGFAWDPFRNHKTLVRGGYGIYFQRLSNQDFVQGSLGPPFFVSLVQNNPIGISLANPLSNQPPNGAVATDFIPQRSRFAGIAKNGNPNDLTGNPNNPDDVPVFVNDSGAICNTSGLNPAGTANNCAITLSSFATVPVHPKVPYTQQWNLTVQRDLGRAWILEAGYVGSHYLHGLGIFAPFLSSLASPANPISVTDINGKTYSINTNTVNNEPLRVAALGLSPIYGARVDGNIGFAIYHSAQLTLAHHFQKGLFLQGAYTWSKTIDNVSGSQSIDELNPTQNGQFGALLANFGNRNPALNRSIGDFDRPHRFVMSYIYDLPVPRHGIWGTQAFQGWSISGINTFQSGLPFSVIDGNGALAFGSFGFSTGAFLCNSIAGAYNPGSVQSQIVSGGSYLNPACFGPSPLVPNGATDSSGQLPPTGYGNVPRNAFRGPFQQNWDASVLKRFKLYERHSLEFRADFFNVLNHPVFRQPSFVNIGTSTFGQIDSTVVPARIIQLGAQYAF